MSYVPFRKSVLEHLGENTGWTNLDLTNTTAVLLDFPAFTNGFYVITNLVSGNYTAATAHLSHPDIRFGLTNAANDPVVMPVATNNAAPGFGVNSLKDGTAISENILDAANCLRSAQTTRVFVVPSTWKLSVRANAVSSVPSRIEYKVIPLPYPIQALNVGNYAANNSFSAVTVPTDLDGLGTMLNQPVNWLPGFVFLTTVARYNTQPSTTKNSILEVTTASNNYNWTQRLVSTAAESGTTIWRGGYSQFFIRADATNVKLSKTVEAMEYHALLMHIPIDFYDRRL